MSSDFSLLNSVLLLVKSRYIVARVCIQEIKKLKVAGWDSGCAKGVCVASLSAQPLIGRLQTVIGMHKCALIEVSIVVFI